MQDIPAESQEALRRIVFCGKLVLCVTVIIHVVFLCDMPGRKKSSRQKKTAGSAAGSTSVHPKEELHARFPPLYRGQSIPIIGIANWNAVHIRVLLLYSFDGVFLRETWRQRREKYATGKRTSKNSVIGKKNKIILLWLLGSFLQVL